MSQDSLHPGRAALLAGVVAGSLFFWDAWALYPVKLLATMAHETGHALAALALGGQVDRVSVLPSQAGFCISRFPDGFLARVLVSSGGYLGAVLFAVLLLVGTFRFSLRRALLYGACAWLLGVALLYARDPFTLAFSLGMAVVFAALARWLPHEAVGFVNTCLAGFMTVRALVDVRDVLLDAELRSRSDAAILAQATWIPAELWALLWAAASVVILLVGLRHALVADGPPRAVRAR